MVLGTQGDKDYRSPAAVIACLGSFLSRTLKGSSGFGSFFWVAYLKLLHWRSNLFPVITWLPLHLPMRASYIECQECDQGTKRDHKIRFLFLFVGNPFLPPYVGAKKFGLHMWGPKAEAELEGMNLSQKNKSRGPEKLFLV